MSRTSWLLGSSGISEQFVVDTAALVGKFGARAAVIPAEQATTRDDAHAIGVVFRKVFGGRRFARDLGADKLIGATSPGALSNGGRPGKLGLAAHHTT